jgi:hypothetical protein
MWTPELSHRCAACHGACIERVCRSGTGAQEGVHRHWELFVAAELTNGADHVTVRGILFCPFCGERLPMEVLPVLQREAPDARAGVAKNWRQLAGAIQPGDMVILLFNQPPTSLPAGWNQEHPRSLSAWRMVTTADFNAARCR